VDGGTAPGRGKLDVERAQPRRERAAASAPWAPRILRDQASGTLEERRVSEPLPGTESLAAFP
jgi:hypothetical protein